MQLIAPPPIPSHADLRSAEILDSVRQTFVEKGFDGASMQDLARAAEMSVGNLYRYFPSKAAMIRAMILRDAEEVQQDFARIITSDHPMQTLREVIRQRILDSDCHKDSELWAEIEAASRRSPEIADAAHHMEAQVLSFLGAVFAREYGMAEQQANRRFSTEAAYILTMIKAASCLSCTESVDRGAVRAMILHSIDQTLDAIAAARLEPA